MPEVSLVVPAYNVAETIGATLQSLLSQTFDDFELIVVDDGSTDDTVTVVNSFTDVRIRLIRQRNRGLSGAHNTGIAAANGAFIGFCDADDLWLPEKLACHVVHLRVSPHVGISFSGSEMIDLDGRPLGLAQRPRLLNIDAAHVLKRNPIGNGSAPVMRREALDDLRYRPAGETVRDWWFDETFRQSDDIEGWARFAATSDWMIEGIPGLLTLYRINPHGLSANVDRQLETWERMLAKLESIAPDLVRIHGPAARAYQHRYLCRRAIASRDRKAAARLLGMMLRGSKIPFVEEPGKTIATVAAAAVLGMSGSAAYSAAESAILSVRKLTLA